MCIVVPKTISSHASETSGRTITAAQGQSWSYGLTIPKYVALTRVEWGPGSSRTTSSAEWSRTDTGLYAITDPLDEFNPRKAYMQMNPDQLT
ncbi:hypothetical protein EVAR_29621_1 [Eumeta japonica]|uniref:Uncharacterized protein n=1 Tax=Eumeta variegata TaxID=151549 RepID=A0A4C1VVE0_EUMVA|nr:hypothetical protein EVAR_29621_1 [Eumeta japonica]